MPIIYARIGFLFCTFYIPAAISRLQGDDNIKLFTIYEFYKNLVVVLTK